MKKVILATVIIGFAVQLCIATDDLSPTLNYAASIASPIAPLAMGDVNWTMDVTTPTGDTRCVGVEFDGVNFWVTGAFDLTKAYLYEISPQGLLVNSFLQPVSHWGGWGWRDLSYHNGVLWESILFLVEIFTTLPTSRDPFF